MDRTPALLIEQVQANYAVRVDVRMHGNLVLGVLDEHNFGRFNRVALAEAQFKAVGLVLVEWIVVQDTNVYDPLLIVLCRDEEYARR
jgi:hypothetical protein